MKFTNKFSEVKALVIGDVMLDRYWWGSVSRISPEAPVPVVDLEKISETLGGAANVAANISGLGATPFLIGVVGVDADSEMVCANLTVNKISTDFLVQTDNRCTTVKTRIVAHNQQIARVDREVKDELDAQTENEILRIADKLIDQVEIVIVSDYGKGLVTETLIRRLITKCQSANKFILIDPKGKNYSKYSGATMLTPNRFEIAEACDLNNYSQKTVETVGDQLLYELSLQYLLVTQGEDGMTLFEKDQKAKHLPVESKNVFDVTGAGDTVIACLAVSLGAGASFLEAAQLANRAAGLVIEKIGTTAITQEMLNQIRQ